jgi:hypothetical protein
LAPAQEININQQVAIRDGIDTIHAAIESDRE